MQVIPSGPDVASDALFDLLVSLIYEARERLWVVTPYFVPDDALSRGLGLAARRGVDARIIVPDPSNHRLADLARGPYLRDLQTEGCRILRHKAGMVHAKTVVADNVAVVGSANLDPRSLFLNSELALILYDEADVESVVDWTCTLGNATEEGVNQVTRRQELVEGVARLLAPLL